MDRVLIDFFMVNRSGSCSDRVEWKLLYLALKQCIIDSLHDSRFGQGRESYAMTAVAVERDLANPERREEAASPAPTPDPSRRILVVEDNEDTRQSFQQLLEHGPGRRGRPGPRREPGAGAARWSGPTAS